LEPNCLIINRLWSKTNHELLLNIHFFEKMKNSNKILIGLAISLFVYLVSGKIAERLAFSGRQKIEFEPGLSEKNAQPFKVIVIESMLEPNSELIVKKSTRFAVAADPNFWKSADFSQRGDTIFVHQTSQKYGKLSDPTNHEENDYGEIRVLCPGGLTAIWSDISLTINELTTDSLQIHVTPNRFKTDFNDNKCELNFSKCQAKSLGISASRNAKIDLDAATQLENLVLLLKDSSSAEVNAFVGQQISVDCASKANLSLSGANISKLKK
jgi:hypothetical protein